MDKFFDGVLKVIAVIDKIVKTLIIAAMSVIVTVLLLQVILRYIFNYSIPWGSELARYLLIWTIFLVAGVGFKAGDHMAVDILVDRLPEKAGRALTFFTHFVVLVFVVWIAKQGYFLVPRLFSQTSAALQISMSYAYLAVPVGCSLMAIYMLELIIRKDIRREGEGGKE